MGTFVLEKSFLVEIVRGEFFPGEFVLGEFDLGKVVLGEFVPGECDCKACFTANVYFLT